MIKTQTPLKKINKKEYLITASLLNAWGYIWTCEDSVRESQNDTMCIEDKIETKRQEAYDSFIKTLNRIPSEPNEYMLAGIKYEDDCYKGLTEVSPIIEGGAFQIVGVKHKTIKGINFVLYGRLDVLKGGVIYDIKKVVRYAPQKYLHSYQHPFYLELFKDSTYKFTYLVQDNYTLHKETYFRDECVNIENVIADFISWLDQHNLLATYLEKWQSKY